MRIAILSLITLLTSVAWAQNGLEASWSGAVEVVSAERVVFKNEDGRYSISKRMIQEVLGAADVRAGEYFEIAMPLDEYLKRVEKNRDLYLVKELGRMPASAK